MLFRDLRMSSTVCVLYETRTTCHSRSHGFTTGFLVGSVFLIIFAFCDVYFIFVLSLFRVLCNNIAVISWRYNYNTK